ncbi:MAG TPA: LD-carboxypeptidase [Verrucomicrobiae bacterium]
MPTTRTILKPAALQPGDIVGLVAPASPPANPQSIDQALAALADYGFKPRPGRHLRARHGFLAGTDRERADDLMRMFLDKKVQAIFCLRGGYGSYRLLERLDYGLIRRHPKILAGYSDITALHLAIQRRAGLITFHAPMWNGALADTQVPAFTRAAFLRTLTEPRPAGSIRQDYPANTVQIVRRGEATGRLVGGNLSLICATLGTPYAPVFKNRILCFEDINETPARLDRMLAHLGHANVWQQVAGVAVGVNKDCEEKDSPARREYRQSSHDVLVDHLSRLNVPVVTGLPFGHVDLNATLPLGARARLDGKLGDLIITEAAVR